MPPEDGAKVKNEKKLDKQNSVTTGLYSWQRWVAIDRKYHRQPRGRGLKRGLKLAERHGKISSWEKRAGNNAWFAWKPGSGRDREKGSELLQKGVAAAHRTNRFARRSRARV